MAPSRRWVLARRPHGLPVPEDFGVETVDVPDPGEGQMLVRNVWIPVDPGMRNILSSEDPGPAEFKPQPLGATVGYLTVGVVMKSRLAGFAEGDYVTDYLLWQERALSDGSTARRITERRLSPTTAVGVLGVPGLSAYFGLLELGALKAGETVLVTSAAGAVGSVAGQIARIRGCRAVGVAGGTTKCAWVSGGLGFDAAIDYKAEPDLAAAVAKACPDGIDVLFDNVGGALLDSLLPLMALHGRIVICGQTAEYGRSAAERAGLKNISQFVPRRLSMKGLFVHDFADRFDEAIAELADWTVEGRIKTREELVQGFEQLPQAFCGLFHGEGFGRKVVSLEGEAWRELRQRTS
jgi:NADPH-dependent curcumin reductase CurA